VVQSFGRVFAVSPQLDDAVLSAGGFLAEHPGSCVVTVFAGAPARYGELSEWDAACGFEQGDDIVALRKLEDERALAQLSAAAGWLDFLDGQYSDVRPAPGEVAEALRERALLYKPDTIAFPLGLLHTDHELTHEAGMTLLGLAPGLAQRWVVWADVPYRSLDEQAVGRRLESLRGLGFQLTPVEPPASELTARKPAALAEYPSQLRALGPSTVEDSERAEEIYLLVRG
jgi:LmbE family N-acetylglucosaminyl deacetylase